MAWSTKEELVRAVTAVAADDASSHAVARTVLAKQTAQGQRADPPQLSPRGQMVLDLLVDCLAQL